tara:strand:- start:5979 stop:7865 length:1887 start_codon:yes stop_codon:yes gene_type:complete
MLKTLKCISGLIENKGVVLFFLLISSACLSQFADYKQTLGQIDGMPISNFAVAANISEQGELFNGIANNPGQLGKWLEYRGKAILSFGYKGKKIGLLDFLTINNQRQFPISKLHYADHKELPISVVITSWAPCVKDDYFTTALPVIQVEIMLKNETNDAIDFDINWALDEVFSEAMEPFKKDDMYGIANQYTALSSNYHGVMVDGGERYSTKISLQPNQEIELKTAISLYDKDWVTSSKYKSSQELAKYTFDHWDFLKTKTEEFDKALPLTTDKELNSILRWYMVPGMILTKCTINNEVVTMGYNELNQRDSYWTSWIHLALFPKAEKIMIEESIAAIKTNGKIPTTILPKIERMDDLDINAFFILRFFRYVNLHNDYEFSAKHWNVIVKAMDWLVSRDVLQEGLPQQKSYWGDWKDVSGVQGRKYSPFTGMLYLAALKECMSYASDNNISVLATRYKKRYKKGYRLLNKSDAKGGLWTGSYYRQVWYDERESDVILQDQTVGAFFGVVIKDRANKIFETLNKNNLTPYGIAETFPYYPKSFGYNPGEYHNGGVWPWLSFMDIWSRLKHNRKEEALDLLKKVAKADLFDSKDYTPNEHINSINGKNLGVFMQGWNAALFGVYYFENLD